MNEKVMNPDNMELDFKNIKKIRAAVFSLINIFYIFIFSVFLSLLMPKFLYLTVFCIVISVLLIIFLIKHFKNIKYFFKIEPSRKADNIVILSLQALFTAALSAVFILFIQQMVMFHQWGIDSLYAHCIVQTYEKLNHQMRENKPAFSSLNDFEKQLIKGLDFRVYSNSIFTYSITKFQNQCRIIDTQNYTKSDCLIEIDINGRKRPNKLNKDRFIFIIDGKDNKIKASKSVWQIIRKCGLFCSDLNSVDIYRDIYPDY